jgi:hypothetical protein
MELARAARMNLHLSWRRAALVAVALLLPAAGLLVAQGHLRGRAHDGPWRVVISKPVIGLGWEAGTLYREHEYLSAMCNQLDRDGLDPVLMQVMTERLQGKEPADRMIVLCRVK